MLCGYLFQRPLWYIFECMKIILRAWKMDDLPSLQRHANNPNIAKFMTNQFPHLYTLDAGRTFIEFAHNENHSHLWAIEYEGKAIGGIGLHTTHDVLRKNVEIGYWIGEDFWGRGMMSEAIKETVQWAFEHLDVSRIYARVFGNNLRSASLLEKCGFQKEVHVKDGIFKNNEFLDELIFATRK